MAPCSAPQYEEAHTRSKFIQQVSITAFAWPLRTEFLAESFGAAECKFAGIGRIQFPCSSSIVANVPNEYPLSLAGESPFQWCISGIPDATVIVLTEAERTELDGLARSTRTEYRLRQRVRYAEKRRAGLDETGKRGAAPRYTA
jgi:hypothetical protein